MTICGSFSFAWLRAAERGEERGPKHNHHRAASATSISWIIVSWIAMGVTYCSGTVRVAVGGMHHDRRADLAIDDLFQRAT